MQETERGATATAETQDGNRSRTPVLERNTDIPDLALDRTAAEQIHEAMERLRQFAPDVRKTGIQTVEALKPTYEKTEGFRDTTPNIAEQSERARDMTRSTTDLLARMKEVTRPQIINQRVPG